MEIKTQNNTHEQEELTATHHEWDTIHFALFFLAQGVCLFCTIELLVSFSGVLDQ